MRKCFFVLLVVLSLSSVLATDVAYVVRNVNNVETNVISGIEELGFSYELIDDSKISSTDFDKYGMILVWNELLADAELLPIDKKNSLVANVYYLEDWGIADYAGSQISSGYVSGKILINNMITDGFVLFSSIKFYDRTNVVLYHLPYYIKRAPGIKNVVSTSNYNEYPVIGTLNAGGKLYGGGTAMGRIAFFGIIESDSWSTNSMELFKNTLHWVLTGEDGDGDGFFYNEDCNDANADAWQLLSGYLDSDGDGFGIGNLLDVCSGDFLVKGYSEIDGDCNDFDASYNFDSVDVYKNCVNDAPIVYWLEELVFNESDIVVVDLNVTDPEGDILEYEIDDDRFVKEGGVFSWQTGSDDEGFYVFYMTISDGEFEVIVRIEIEIFNQLPIWDEIFDVEWDEDTNNSLDLNLYVFDGDGDNLTFFVNSTSIDKSIKIDNIKNGIVNFSVDKNWNGGDWVVFGVWDGSEIVNSGNVTLRVLPVNDAPVFSGKIGNKSWKEGGGLEGELNLNDYFSDVDFPIGDFVGSGSNGASDKLEFGVEGNGFIVVEINQSSGFVSFSSDDDWWGNESVIFSATDGFEVVHSNVVGLSVVDVNEFPEFAEFGCDVEIDEDVRYECELNASDFEGDDFKFSVADEENMKCNINGNNLSYVSKKNYAGDGSCLIRVSDDFGYSEILIGFEILPINDAPEIVKYFPVGNPKIMQNTDEVFDVEVFDVDGDSVAVLWILNSSNVSVSGDEYLFNQEKGIYFLEVVVSDGELSDNYTWNIFVGDISDFSCEEVGGFKFGIDEICLGDVLGVLDESCCSIAPEERPPEFSDAKTCSSDGLNLSADLEISIREPKKGDEFEPGEDVDVEVRIDNGLDENLDFDVEVSLYDTSDEVSVDDDKDSVDVKKRSSERLEFVLNFPNDADAENDYVVFARVVDKGEVYCNEIFVKVDLERVENDIGIESLKIVGEDYVCGDYVSVEGRIKNFGSSEQDDVVFVLKNSELGIFEETEKFELEGFGDNDDARKFFDFSIPEDAVAGEYELEGVVSYDGGEFSSFVNLNLGKCKKFSVSSSVVEPISLNVFSESAVEENGNLGFVILAGALVLLLVVLIGFLVL